MIAQSFIIEAVQILILLAAAPAFAGWVKTVKCRMQGRTYAGIFQPYRDIAKLFAKEVILAENASWIFRVTPYIVFGVTVMIGGIVPLISVDLPFAATADVIALVMLFAIIRFFTALAGMDIGTAFGGMGSSREMTIASLAEPAMLMLAFTLSLQAGSTQLASVARYMMSPEAGLHVSLALALAGILIVAIAENGRIPVDNPSTHLELTMVHEAMVLEYSGRHLALIEAAAMLKLLLYMSLVACVFAPWGMVQTAVTPGAFVAATLIYVAKLAAGGFLLAVFETSVAKMRVFRVPDFLGAALMLGLLGTLLLFVSRSV